MSELSSDVGFIVMKLYELSYLGQGTNTGMGIKHAIDKLQNGNNSRGPKV